MSNKPKTLIELLRTRAESQPDSHAYTFLVDGETTEVSVTYGELDQQARTIGAHLQSVHAERQPVHDPIS